MMNLELMHDVLQTLDGEGRVIEPILHHWNHDPGSLHFLRASATFVFTFTQAGRPRILRFSHTRERATEAVKAELEFIRHLIARGVRVAEPVASSTGRDVERVTTSLGTFNASAFASIPGEQPECSEMTEDMFARWGRALAKLHNATAGYRIIGRPTWQDHLTYVAEHLSPELTEAHALLHTVNRRLAEYPVSDVTFGLIHFDFEPDNLVWQGSQVWAIDFDDCAYYPFAADIAFALRELFDDRPEGVNLEDTRLRTFVGGYRELRPVDDAQLAAMPLFLAAHNLLTFVKLGRSLDASRPADDPQWLSGLRQRLERKRLTYLQSFAETAL